MSSSRPNMSFILFFDINHIAIRKKNIKCLIGKSSDLMVMSTTKLCESHYQRVNHKARSSAAAVAIHIGHPLRSAGRHPENHDVFHGEKTMFVGLGPTECRSFLYQTNLFNKPGSNPNIVGEVVSH